MGFLQRWIVAAVLSGLTACASQTGEREFTLASGERVHFAGQMDDDAFVEGKATFSPADASAELTSFEGHFDAAGFPAAGRMEQVLLGTGGELLTLHLIGNFDVHHERLTIDFLGEFILLDSRGRTLAEGSDSRWQGMYADANPYLAPGQLGLNGAVTYRQHRRDLPLAERQLGLIDIQRPLRGPFLVAGAFYQGAPQGEIRITAENIGGKAYLTEHQFFSDYLRYFYYEPGSFSAIDLLGDCADTPTLTVPIKIMQAFAYDCANTVFLAVSPEFRGAQVAIHAEDIDNSGAVKRIQVRRGERLIDMQVDGQMLYDGTLIPQGQVLEFYRGGLQSLRDYHQGQPVGIGISVDGDQARYRRYHWPEATLTLPPPTLMPALSAQYRQRQAAVADLVGKPRASKRETLASANQLIDNATLPAEGEQVAGLRVDLQRWQQDSRARVTAWADTAGRSEDALNGLQRSLTTVLDQWWQTSHQRVVAQGQQACAAQGKSLSIPSWQCDVAPTAATEALCAQYLGEETCQQMARTLVMGDLGG
ncbi:hypothetical protein NCG89_01600 [Spongiibacter taiwanensis]|uniref:hypothetical protein n=1 Tax=Spongiibacter taiwanensis TaxID=1748242 RepID=UPI0020364243|nr:hypothetical protein [Spongiibacter taiwanensis]USA43495.1 hypothetical protein NCG89_01600 [Spongiibacter taiwanensis]